MVPLREELCPSALRSSWHADERAWLNNVASLLGVADKIAVVGVVCMDGEIDLEGFHCIAIAIAVSKETNI